MKRALGNTSRDRPAERWPERDEEDLERCIEEEEEEEEERARALKEKESQLHSAMQSHIMLDVLALPSCSSHCQAGWGWIGARTPVLPGANVEVGSQLWHLSGGVRVGGRARGFLPGISELGRGAGREATKVGSRTEPDSQAVAKEGVELTVHGRQRDRGPLLPGTASPTCLKVAGDSQGSL